MEVAVGVPLQETPAEAFEEEVRVRLLRGFHEALEGVYTGKVVVSGNMIEFYEYEHPVRPGKSPGRAKEAETEAAREKNRQVVLYRAREAIRRIVQANIGVYLDDSGRPYKPVFATFTFAENVTDLDQANEEWKRFIKRLCYALKGSKRRSLQYLVVPEFQKRGAVHYHVIFFNLPYLPANELARIWGQGFVKINALEDVAHVGAYVCKYLSKDQADSRLEGRKCYFTSRGLRRPVEYHKKSEIRAWATLVSDDAPSIVREWDSEHAGRVRYLQYNLR